MIAICPNCNKKDNYPTSSAGKDYQCGRCGKYFALPDLNISPNNSNKPNHAITATHVIVSYDLSNISFFDVLSIMFKIAVAGSIISIISIIIYFLAVTYIIGRIF